MRSVARRPKVYFTSKSTGAIHCAIVTDRKIVAHDVFQEDVCPQSWRNALQEMEECLKTRREPAQPGGGRGIDFSADDIMQGFTSPEDHGSLSPSIASDVDRHNPRNEVTGGTQSLTDYSSFSALANEPDLELDFELPPEALLLNSEYSNLGSGMISTPSQLPALAPSSSILNAAEVDALLDFSSSHLLPSELPPSPRLTTHLHILNTSITSQTSKGGTKLSHALALRANVGSKTPNLSSKRMAKLQNLLDSIRSHPVPTVKDYNERVDGLYRGPQAPCLVRAISIVHFAGVLGRLGDISSTLGFVYGLLSWEIFRVEEERIAKEENLHVNIAAKRVSLDLCLNGSCLFLLTFLSCKGE